nr:hypothetical protein [Trochiscia hystrix]
MFRKLIRTRFLCTLCLNFVQIFKKLSLYFFAMQVLTSSNKLFSISFSKNNIKFKRASKEEVGNSLRRKISFLCQNSLFDSANIEFDCIASNILNSLSSDKKKDNSVSNQIQPRKQPGIYMIRCTVNDMRYYGESKNVSGRLASHKSMLNRKIHENPKFQHDWNTFGADAFDFVVLFMGPQWESREERRAKETLLIIEDRKFCYNYLESSSRPNEKNPFWGKTHTEKTKKKIGDAMRGIPKEYLGKPINLDGIIFPSISEASRVTKHSRKYIRKRLEDPNDRSCTEPERSSGVSSKSEFGN